VTGRIPAGTPRIPAKGLLLLALGRKAGFDHFGTDGDAYLASLAPLLALGLVGSVWHGVEQASWRLGAALSLRLICVLLAPAVVAEVFCRRWKRAGQWALYANMLNWSVWLSWFALVVLLLGSEILSSAGVNGGVVISLAALALFAYLGWFHWFLARQILAVSRRRVFLLLLCSLLVSLAIAAVSVDDDQDAAHVLLSKGSVT
jgi:hypothetical protein